MILVVLAFLYSVSLGYKENDPVVSTKRGLIRGLRDDLGYSKFLGIPYGQIVGNNYFAAAVPHTGYQNVFEAYDDSKVCIQMNPQGPVVGTTDCLNLNIYVPDIANPDKLVPVMVWIHGNTFNRGSAIAECSDPHALLRHGVIVVSINYRLGIFGFMCLDTPEIPGNTGLKDQVLALRWINDNIEAFGGDASKITVFGKRSGAMAINLHLFSSYEKLFSRAIIQSGPAFSYLAITEADPSIPIKIAEEIGFSTKDTEAAVHFLLESNVNTVAKVAHNLFFANASLTDQRIGPCLEKQFNAVENFITEHPMNLKAEKAKDTSIIIGYNNKEFDILTASLGKKYFQSFNFSSFLAMGFEMTYNLNEALEFIKNYYIGDQEISFEVKDQLIKFGSDYLFNYPTHRMAKKLLESGAEIVYSYIFSYDGDVDLTKTWYEVNTAEELTYLFDLNIEDNSLQDHLITDEMTELWSNFANVANPTPQYSEITVKWRPISNNSRGYLEIDSDLTLMSRPYFDRMSFWDLFYKLYEKHQKWYKNDDESTPEPKMHYCV